MCSLTLLKAWQIWDEFPFKKTSMQKWSLAGLWLAWNLHIWPLFYSWHVIALDTERRVVSVAGKQLDVHWTTNKALSYGLCYFSHFLMEFSIPRQTLGMLILPRILCVFHIFNKITFFLCRFLCLFRKCG